MMKIANNNKKIKKRMSQFDFSKVEVPVSTSYLKPGMYKLTVKDAKYNAPEGKTPFIEVTLGNSEGIMREKFYITIKALPRLQYLHKGLFGKVIEKDLQSEEQVGAYFERALTHKPIEKGYVVSGTRNDEGKVYTNLRYDNFFIPDGQGFEEGAFDEDSANYKENVKNQGARKTSPLVEDNDSVVLSEDSTSPWD